MNEHRNTKIIEFPKQNYLFVLEKLSKFSDIIAACVQYPHDNKFQLLMGIMHDLDGLTAEELLFYGTRWKDNLLENGGRKDSELIDAIMGIAFAINSYKYGDKKLSKSYR